MEPEHKDAHNNPIFQNSQMAKYENVGIFANHMNKLCGVNWEKLGLDNQTGYNQTPHGFPCQFHWRLEFSREKNKYL